MRLEKRGMGNMYRHSITFSVTGVHSLQFRAWMRYVASTLEDSANYVMCDWPLQIGREFMADERKDSENKAHSPREEIIEFAIYLLGLVLGAAAFVAFFYATAGTYKLLNGVSIPPDIAFVFKWVAYWFLFCGAVCAVVFVTKISYDFIMFLGRKRHPKT